MTGPPLALAIIVNAAATALFAFLAGLAITQGDGGRLAAILWSAGALILCVTIAVQARTLERNGNYWR